MENTDNKNNATQSGEGDKGDKKTFDELLHENPDFQSELDKKIASAISKTKEKWEKEAEAQKLEAERLAKLSEEEKVKEALNKANAEKDAITKKYDAIMLKQEAMSIAKEKGVDTSLLDLIDFSNESAESVKTKIDKLGETFGNALNKALEDKLKQKSPEQHNTSNNSNDGGGVNRASY